MSARQRLPFCVCSCFQTLFSLAPPPSVGGQGKASGMPSSPLFSLPLHPVFCLLCVLLFLYLALPLEDISLGGRSHLVSGAFRLSMAPVPSLHVTVMSATATGHLLMASHRYSDSRASKTEIGVFLQRGLPLLLRCLSSWMHHRQPSCLNQSAGCHPGRNVSW